MPKANQLIVKAPGNGDCLYHSVMLNIIHGALTGKITDDSKTGKSIITYLLPAITRQLKARGRKINFTGKTLKDAIITLLKSAPLENARIVKSSKSAAQAAISQCDLYHLFRDITGPALRDVMLQGADNYPEFNNQAKKIIRLEFRNHLIATRGKELNFNDGDIAAAKNYLQSSEFFDLPKNISAAIYKEWNKIELQFSTMYKSKAFIKALFNDWWNDSKAASYKNLHRTNGIMAGAPQIHALGLQLQCQLTSVGSKNNIETLESPAIENANTFLYQSTSLHYDAIVENDTVGITLQTSMKAFDEKQADLKDSQYNWKAKIPEEIIPVENDVTSMTTTLSVIKNYEAEKNTESLNTASKDIIAAAKQGYRGALQATTFGKHLNHIGEINLAKLNDKDRKEAENFLYLIEEQNKEINIHLNRK